MIRTRALADVLKAAVPALRFVGTARDFAAAQAGSIVFPSAFIIMLAESSSESRYQSCELIDQRVTARFGIIQAVRDIGTRTGDRALSEVETIREAVIAAMGAHVPPGCDTACTPVSGRLLGGVGKDGSMFFQDDFKTAFNRRITRS